MRVAVTGSHGRVGSLLVPRLRDRFELTLIDAAPGGEDHLVLNVADTDALAEALAGADAVVHLAGRAARDSSWEELRTPNIDGVHSLFEASRRAGLSKVVYASSSHVTGGYDQLQDWPVDPGRPVRPDRLYGVTKVFGEAMGRFYADEFGISVMCLRIGWVRADPAQEARALGLDAARRMWLSPGDLAQLVEKALVSDVQFGIYYGVSANRHRRWSIENARTDLGYAPEDDSSAEF